MRGVPGLLLCLFPLAAAAEKRQFGNVVYELPPGWVEGATRDGYRVFLSDLPDDRCEFCYIYLDAGRKGSGKVTTYLRSERGRFVDEEDRAGIEIVQEAEEATLGGRPGAIMAIQADGAMQVLVAVRLDGRFQMMGFQGGTYDEAELAETMGVLEEQVFGFFEGLAYVSDGAEPLLPAAAPGGMDGLWWGWKTDWRMQLDGTMMMEIDHRWIVFWPDGHFYDGTPPEGLKPLNRDALVAAGNTEFGVYAESGDTLVLTFADGASDRLTREDGGWNDGERSLVPVETLPDGATVDGSLSSFFFTGFTPGVGVEGGVSAGSNTEFRPDGTYSGSSYGGAFGNFVDGAGDLTGGFATSSDSGEKGGRYEIRDGLMIQYPADGSPPVSAMVYIANGDTMIDGQALETSGAE